MRNGKNKRLGSEGNASGASYSEPVSGYGSNTNYGSQGGYEPQQNLETNQGRRYNQQQGIAYGGRCKCEVQDGLGLIRSCSDRCQ